MLAAMRLSLVRGHSFFFTASKCRSCAVIGGASLGAIWPSALGKWGRTQLGSDGHNRRLTGFYFFSLVGIRLVPLKTRDLKLSAPSHRIRNR